MSITSQPVEILFQNLNRFKKEIDEESLKELSLEKTITLEDFVNMLNLLKN